ncbi:MAG TPA: hypothetical protein VFZ00_33355 [Solirubrobacter sp.]|nr:hypothetical protein [Solirubrobacter sp.]
MSPPLAQAFLALADDDSLPAQRTLPRVVTAALAAVLLAIGAPLALLVVKDQPVAALNSKAWLLDDE